MKALVCIFLTFSFGLLSCKVKNEPPSIVFTPEALYDSTKNLRNKWDLQGRKLTLELLDKVTNLDSNHYQAYFDKLPLLSDTKDYGKALVTANHMIRIRPEDPNLFVMRGGIYYHLGDTLFSIKDFQKGSDLYDKLLDTLPRHTFGYPYKLFSKAVALILVGKEASGRRIIDSLGNTPLDDRLHKAIINISKQTRRDVMESSFW